MSAIVWFKGMPCKRMRHGWRVRLWESRDEFFPDGSLKRAGTGQREAVAYPRMVMVPVDGETHQRPCDWVAYDRCDHDLEEMERRAAQNAARAARRARQGCRLKIKHAGFKELLTLTYRENMADLDRMRRDFAAWLRIMRRIIPGFRAVYGFEQQERGAWHVHVATDRLPALLQYKGLKVKSWKVGTAVWRSVVPAGGMCFVGGRKGGLNRCSSPAKIAGYISKYLTKDNAAGAEGRRMWDSTRDLTPPKAITLDLPEGPLAEIISAAFSLPLGHRVVSHRMNPDREVWVLYTEPSQ